MMSTKSIKLHNESCILYKIHNMSGFKNVFLSLLLLSSSINAFESSQVLPKTPSAMTNDVTKEAIAYLSNGKSQGAIMFTKVPERPGVIVIAKFTGLAPIPYPWAPRHSGMWVRWRIFQSKKCWSRSLEFNCPPCGRFTSISCRGKWKCDAGLWRLIPEFWRW